MQTLEDFLRRHPSTFIVHSKAITAMLQCSDCCGVHNGGIWSPWKRESKRYSDQMQCLYGWSNGSKLQSMCDLKAMSVIVDDAIQKQGIANPGPAGAADSGLVRPEHKQKIGGAGKSSGSQGVQFKCATQQFDKANFTCTKDALYDQLSSLDVSDPALHQRASQEGYTIAISSFSRDRSLAKHALRFTQCPYVKQIDIVWHDPNRTPPDWLKAKLQHPRIHFREQTTDLLTNRFRSPLKHSSTDAIFSVDDDRFVPCRKMTEAFLLWLHLRGDAMVLPERWATRWFDLGAGVRGSRVQFPAWRRYNTGWVTMAGFLHKKFFSKFFEPQFERLRTLVDKHVTGEDMLMSAIHAGPVVGILALDGDSEVCMSAEFETTVVVGASKSATKQVTVPSNVWCPSNAADSNAGFAVSTALQSKKDGLSRSAIVTVTQPEYSGWETNLTLTCCKKGERVIVSVSTITIIMLISSCIITRDTLRPLSL